MTSQTDQRSSTRGRVLEELRRRIVSLELAPSSALSENDLARELGVSRTPVRESLIILREEGMVRVFPQLGSFVAPIDVTRVAEAQFVRESLECAALAQIGRDARPELLDAVMQNLQEQRDAESTGDVERFFQLDEAFHRGLLQLSGHGGIWNTVVGAKAHLDRARRLSLVDTRPIATLIEQHVAVADAVAGGNVAAAVDALRIHLRMVFDDIERIQAARPELFSTGEGKPSRRVITTLS